MIRVLMILLLLFTFVPGAVGEVPRIGVVTLAGTINPVTSDHLVRAIQQAPARGEQLLLVEIDTPGGLDSAMRDSVKGIFASPVPVVVYVAPSGARAASAGALIALAADVCAMAPGTNIGAAHPVSLGEKPDEVMKAKVLNDAEAYAEGIATRRGRNADLAKRMVRESLSVSAEGGLEAKVVDIIAADRAELLKKLDGRSLQHGARSIVLRTAGAEVVVHEMGLGARVLDTISNPNFAYILMMLGLLGLFFELSTPGAMLPGIIGGISLILSFFAFQTLSVNYAGILLILLAVALFIAELQVVSHGILGMGGVVSLVFGSVMLFESPEPWLRLSRGVIAVSVVAVAGFFLFAVNRGLKVHRMKPETGKEGLLGETGLADTDLAPEGKVIVHGEYWNAWSENPIAKGERVLVVEIEGLLLKVRKKER